jgi:hypothetical protein
MVPKINPKRRGNRPPTVKMNRPMYAFQEKGKYHK